MEQSTATKPPVDTRLQINPTGDYLTVRQVCNEFGLSEQYLYRLVREGRIPHVRFGLAIRIHRTALEAWLLAREIVSAKTPNKGSKDADR